MISLFAALWAVFASAVTTYTHYEDVAANPDYVRRAVKPPTREFWGNKTHFTSLRWMGWGAYRAMLDQFVDRDKLGDVLWPNFDMLDTTNFTERVQEVKRRNLYLMDMWGFIPGCSRGQGGRTMKLPPEKQRILEETLGARWLGMDIGEYDGNYLHGWAPFQLPLGGTRQDAYVAYQRFFERYKELLGNRVAGLVSLTYAHYFLKDGGFTMLGAETAQALPNAQIYYAFIRGAGKQYGVPWYSGTSIFNRWGWKVYEEDMRTLPPGKNGKGATKGTSLALLKRLFYVQLFYNCTVLGFEGSHYMTVKGKDVLSPIGRLQRRGMDWYEKNGEPGIHQVPVAVMFDVYAGWTVPRHQYSHKVFRVWENLPYDDGDYFADGVLSLFYPGYEDSGYYHDERGFISPTPYGDNVDCVLSDCDAENLARYGVVVLASKMTKSAEFCDTLSRYVAAGGHLVLTKGNAEVLFPKGLPAGKVTILRGAPWGVVEKPQCALPVKYFPCVDKKLARPYPLCVETKMDLEAIFRECRYFSASADDVANGLSLTTCRRGEGEYTICVANNTWEEKPLDITSHIGKITALEELPVDVSERGDVGFTYDGATNITIGADAPHRIAGAGVRLFRVRVAEDNTRVKEVAPVCRRANAARNILHLRGNTSIKEAILKRPTFFRNFGGVLVDGAYFWTRDKSALTREWNWISQQGLEVITDISADLNLFPGLSFADNLPDECVRKEQMLTELLEKMILLRSKDLVIALHQPPELGMKADVAWQNQYANIRKLAQIAQAKGIRLHLRQSPMRYTKTMAELKAAVTKIGAEGVAPAPSLAALLMPYHRGVAAKCLTEETDARLIFLAAPKFDEHEQLTSLSEPFHTDSNAKVLSPILRQKENIRLIFDACYEDEDALWRDVKIVK